MGTTYKVVALDHTRNLKEADVKDAIDTALAEVIQSMSNWDSTSEISRFNTQQGVSAQQISPALAEVMQAAADVNSASKGRFDTTMGPLIELWGFGAPGYSKVPSEAELQTARTLSGHANTLRVTGDRLRKTQAGTQVYLAAIGKGYGADHVGRALTSMGLQDFMVEIGGDLYASGKNAEGLPWQIGIEVPDASRRAVQGVIGVSGKGLASSGDYRNYFEKDGKRYSHLIDPTTGRPVQHRTASATVIAENAMLADAWSTAMLILGREHGMEVANDHNVAVQFIDRDTSSDGAKFQSFTSVAFSDLTT